MKKSRMRISWMASITVMYFLAIVSPCTTSAQVAKDTSETYLIFDRALKLQKAYKIRGAMTVLDSAIIAYESTVGPDHVALLKCLELKAKLLIPLGQYQELEHITNRALKLADRYMSKSDPRLGHLYTDLAIAEIELKKYKLAEFHLQKASHLFTQDSSNLQAFENKVLMEMGILNRKQRQSSEAINYYLLALDGFKSIKDSLGIAKTHSNLGNVYYDIKENALARRHYRLAYQGYHDNHGFRKAIALEGVALTYRKERAYNLAVENLMVSLRFLKESFGPQHYYTKKIVRKIAQDYINLNEYQKGADILINENALSGNALGLQVMAGCQLQLGNLTSAEEYARQGLKLSKSNLLDSIFNIKTLADIFVARGEYEAAEHMYQLNMVQRLRYYPPEDEKIQRAHFAFAKLEYARGNAQRALQIIDTLLVSPNNMYVKLENGSKIRSGIWDQIMNKKCNVLYSEYIKNKSDTLWIATFKACSQYLFAIDTLRKNASNINSQVRIDGRPTGVIEIILNLLYDHYLTSFDEILIGEALLKMDHVRDMLWVDLIQKHATMDVTPSELPRLEKEIKIRKRIASLDLQQRFHPDSNQLREEIIGLKNDLMSGGKKRTPSQEDISLSGEAVLQKLRNLKGQTLSYFITDTFMYRIYVNQDTAIYDRHPFREASRQLIKDVVLILSNQNLHSVNKLKELSHFLLNGLPLDQKENLIVFPDGLLHTLPFEILFDPEDEEYLVKKFPITYCSSLKKVFFSYQEQSYEQNLVAFAPSYGRWTMGDIDTTENHVMATIVREGMMNLPATKNEVQRVNSFVNGQLFLDDDATVNNFIKYSNSSRILHLSMHALAEFNQPVLSRLVFSSEKDEGQISRYRFAGEIAEQTIPSELVVLSACNTGSGEYRRGAGVLSLARAFEYAGAQSTLYSLWKIPDAATGELMEYFYSNLKNGLSKTDALQQAKLTYLNNHQNTNLGHPFYWAGFVLSGNYDKINLSESTWWIWGIGIISLIFMTFLLYRIVFKPSNRIE